MAAETFRLEIASPERLLVNEAVTGATIPGEQGVLGILPGHAPLLSELGIGELSYTLTSGRTHSMAVQGGYLEVSGNHVRVLAHGAEHPSEIDIARAELALKRATERIANPLPGVDVARALNAMKRAQARLAAAKGVGPGSAGFVGMPGPGLNE
jgi:F-type H+-transporting ATPase subunit epsilon